MAPQGKKHVLICHHQNKTATGQKHGCCFFIGIGEEKTHKEVLQIYAN